MIPATPRACRAAALAITLAATLPLAAQAPEQETADPDAAIPAAPSIPAGIALDYIQEAWASEHIKMSQGQVLPGARIYHYCPNCTYRVWARTGTSVTLRTDERERIQEVIIGDENSVIVHTSATVPNIAELKVRTVEVDTNVKLVTIVPGTPIRRIYNFWIITQDVDVPTTTDLWVDVLSAPPSRRDAGTAQRTVARMQAHLAPNTSPEAATEVRAGAARDTSSPEIGWTPSAYAQQQLDERRMRQLAAGDPSMNARAIDTLYGNLRIHEFRPDQIVFDLTVYAPTKEAARVLAPQRVFRDRDWTWLDYGDEAGRRPLPAVLKIEEGTETPVAVTTVGEGGRFLVAKTTGDLVLRSGTHWICIRQTRPESHWVHPAPPAAGQPAATIRADPAPGARVEPAASPQPPAEPTARLALPPHTGPTAPATAPDPTRPIATEAAPPPPARATAQPESPKAAYTVQITVRTDDDRIRARGIIERFLPGIEPTTERLHTTKALSRTLCEAFSAEDIQCRITRRTP